MIKTIIERIKKFIKDHIVDDDPYEKLIRKVEKEKSIDTIETPFKEKSKRRGRPKKNK